MVAAAERAELHKTIWRIANDLRGSVDGWDFKSYVLGFLFYRFISENLTDYLNEKERQGILALVVVRKKLTVLILLRYPKKRQNLAVLLPWLTRTSLLTFCATENRSPW